MPKYHVPCYCFKCEWLTQGVEIEGTPKDSRWCLKCKSPLFQCNKCYGFVSHTIKEGIFVCDDCKQPSELAKAPENPTDNKKEGS